jgi:hypothetical protein
VPEEIMTLTFFAWTLTFIIFTLEQSLSGFWVSAAVILSTVLKHMVAIIHYRLGRPGGYFWIMVLVSGLAAVSLLFSERFNCLLTLKKSKRM